MIITEISQAYGDMSGDKTTRRRVYDVLNVFLASGIITKENKTIKYNPPPIPEASKKVSEQDQELLSVNSQKRQQILNKIRLYLTYRSLLERNRGIVKPESAVNLPVILVGFNTAINEVSKSNDNEHTLEIRAAENPTFFSPNDVFKTMVFPEEFQKEVLREMPMFGKLEGDVFAKSE
ncbi:hypothetical protein TRFO_22424 [Tritrichomonas foetus]|uniref:E2F/DP family winged-helix DNA-binding domain-containing protein n=1 Tax=Tritrichomonas foetus TaxID=1144522 RepID=A0A1J4KGI8_9EUKA|nr:hypothetical protein TRFO_22424 [Tritrichomonas foetus]|eukprot:OHT08916.1 hypothetical protein TRFO_22424 [Tritrichomonas foetus]